MTRKRHADTASTYIASIRKSRDILPLSLVTCINITDNKDKCESIPHWDGIIGLISVPGKQFLIHSENQYFVKPRSGDGSIKIFKWMSCLS